MVILKNSLRECREAAHINQKELAAQMDKVLKAGTDVIVAGSAIFGGDIPREMRAFREIMEAGSVV